MIVSRRQFSAGEVRRRRTRLPGVAGVAAAPDAAMVLAPQHLRRRGAAHDAVRVLDVGVALLLGRHEVGAHGYLHENPIAMTPSQEEDVLVKSIELIKGLTGKAPRGYVAPWWEMSNSTAALLLKHGFTYDHSQGYRDFQPFYAKVGDSWNTIDYSKTAKEWMHPLKHGKEIDLVDIAANWYVDDLPPMMFMKKAPNSHGFVNPRDIEEMWRDQFDWVYREMEYAVFAFTIHPDVAGRPQVLLMLERLIEYISKHSGVEWAPFEDIANDFRKRYPFGAPARPEVI